MGAAGGDERGLVGDNDGRGERFAKPHRAAAGVLALGGTVALAAPTTPASPTEAASALPGPKQPIEHLGLSGGLFADTSGEPGCFGASGTKSASFPVPRAHWSPGSPRM